MSTQNDLFPETLLVSRDYDRGYTTSLKVAEHFGKEHSKVMRSIKKAIAETPDEISRANFGARTYIDERGKSWPIYDLTHDGFMFVVQGFTGQKAVAWKWKFIAAFREMEQQVHALKEREARALYHLRPRWQPILLHPEMNRQALIGLTGHKSPGSITACRRRMREAGLFGGDA